MKKLFRKLFLEHSPLQGYVAHFPHGVFTTLSIVYLHWGIGLAFGFGFVVMELMHEWRLKDASHNDIAGFLVGIVVSAIAVFFIR